MFEHQQPWRGSVTDLLWIIEEFRNLCAALPGNIEHRRSLSWFISERNRIQALTIAEEKGTLTA